MPEELLSQFYIDVGGTFTDCLAKLPKQRWQLEKFLSNSSIQGRHMQWLDAKSLRIPQVHPCDNFFRGFRFQLFHPQKSTAVWSSKVLAYDGKTGDLHLSEACPNMLDDLASHHWTWVLQSAEPSPVLAIRWVLSLRLDEPTPALSLRLGTTMATNALLEGKGCAVGLLTSQGFEDLTYIGDQTRPELFRLGSSKSLSLFRSVYGVREWVDHDGVQREKLQAEPVINVLRQWREQGMQSLAICLKNSYRNPVHEIELSELARKAGFQHISCSYQVAAIQNFLERTQTTLLEAYLNPLLKDYSDSLQRALPLADIKFMTSNGGLVSPANFTAKDSVISGPAGGAIAAVDIASQAGVSKAVSFDMGGTSTDVAMIIDGRISFRDKQDIAIANAEQKLQINHPALAIDTVAAGGGSICWFDGVQLRVGPESAGASPGPACYGRGGPLTVTDLNVFMGRLAASDFAFPLDTAAIALRLDELGEKVAAQTRQRLGREQLADGLLKIAVETMAAPIRRLATKNGERLSEFSLISFGGSGPQLALDLAGSLGISHVVVSPMASVLSAYGIGIAPLKVMQRYSLPQNLQSEQAAESILTFVQEKVEQLKEKLPNPSSYSFSFALDLRYVGQDFTISLQQPKLSQIRCQFEAEHQRLFAFHEPQRALELRHVTIEVLQQVRQERPSLAESESMVTPEQKHLSQDGKQQTVVYWQDISRSASIFGPKLVLCPGTAIYVRENWRLLLDKQRNLQISQQAIPEKLKKEKVYSWTDPIQLSLMSHKITSIAVNMGEQLARSAVSINIKERRDFSCAVFNSKGELVVNAPHVPVHLGGMGDTIRHLLALKSPLKPGDVWISNHPYFGGSHLPDVTVITPVFDADQTLRYFLANRAHHAEIGGISPGSMPAGAERLEEEGVIIPFMKAVSQERFCERELLAILQSGLYPSRDPMENLSDFKAQVAANQLGCQLMADLFPAKQSEQLDRFAETLMDWTAQKVSQLIASLEDRDYFYSDRFDDGTLLQLRMQKSVSKQGRPSLVVDFTGSSAQLKGNLNANPAITRAAILYCLRCLIEDDLPLNEGVLRPVEFVIPVGSILNPQKVNSSYPAVVGGNVECSQRICDVVLAALGVSAASQGTMNNVTIGSIGANAFRFYETLGGGMGGSIWGPGRSASQVHMTNTKITDVEVLEERFPVRIREFSRRRGSGGQGRYPGGDGLCREIECLQPVELSLLTQRRRNPPFGLFGGEAAKPGENLLWQKEQETWVRLPSEWTGHLAAGARLRILTPGGGGFGQK